MPAKTPQPLMKDGLGRESVRRLRAAFSQVDPHFDGKKFQRQALRGLSDLELKGRVDHLITVIDAHLPADHKPALATVVAVGEVLRHDGLTTDQTYFAPWPLVDWIGTHAVEHPAASLPALRQLTSVFTAEFAIRPFLLADSKGTLKVLRSWSGDSDHHVRRLISEGTRPLLPWAVQLPIFREDPAPAVALLEKLKDDESEYVRRSVANHLNDVAKDHPEIVLEISRRWWAGGSVARRALVKHGLRTLVKKGSPQALKILGFTTRPQVKASLSVARNSLAIGDSQQLSLQIESKGKRLQKLVIDYAVHHQRSRGKVTSKVFKWKNVEMKPGSSLALTKKHSFVARSVRRLYPGTHRIELLVSGQVLAAVEFELLP